MTATTVSFGLGRFEFAHVALKHHQGCKHDLFLISKTAEFDFYPLGGRKSLELQEWGSQGREIV